MSIEINNLKCLISNIIKVPVDELNKYKKNFSYFTKNDIKNIKSFNVSSDFSNKKNLLILYIYNDYLIYILKNDLGLNIDTKDNKLNNLNELIFYNKKEYYIQLFYLEILDNKFYIRYFIKNKNYILFEKFIQYEYFQYKKNSITITNDIYLNKKIKNILNEKNSNFEIKKNYIDNIIKCIIYYLEDKTIYINYFYINYKIYKLYEIDKDDFMEYKILKYDPKYIKLNSNIYIFI